VTTSALGIDAPPDVVFATLTDVESYPEWLVGAKHIRAVGETWPATGSSFHHTIGFGPLSMKDRTTVIDSHPPKVLVLLAGVSVLGSARVRFTVTDDGNGGSHLAIEEEPATGPMKVLWNPLTRPLLAASLWGRNAISLQSFRALAEERART
jgi:uncharacterized protein YndB with AHSA1/START domain